MIYDEVPFLRLWNCQLPRCLLPLLLLRKSTKQINYTISVSLLSHCFISLCFLSPAQYIGNYLCRLSDMTTATGLYKHAATCNWFAFSYQWVQSTDSCNEASIRIRIRTQHTHVLCIHDLRAISEKTRWNSPEFHAVCHHKVATPPPLLFASSTSLLIEWAVAPPLLSTHFDDSSACWIW